MAETTVVGIAHEDRLGSFGLDYYVNTTTGSDGNDGLAYNRPLLTMAAAFALVGDFSRIFVVGTVAEELLSPLGVQGVSIIGGAQGNTRHDDGCRWKEPASDPTSGGALLTLREQGWELHNILFVPKTDGTAVRLRRNEDATYPDGSHAIIDKCKFIGNVAFGSQGGTGIENYGGSHHDRIENCEFNSLDDALKSSSTAIANPLRWVIQNNVFIDNTNHITLPLTQSIIRGNIFDEATGNLNTSGGGGENFVLENYFSNTQAEITNSNGYTGHASDAMWRNYTNNTAATTVGIPGA